MGAFMVVRNKIEPCGIKNNLQFAIRGVLIWTQPLVDFPFKIKFQFPALTSSNLNCI